MAAGNPRPPALDDNPGIFSLRTADEFPEGEKRRPEMRLLFAGYGILAYVKSIALPVLPAPSFYRNHMTQRGWGWLRGGDGGGRGARGCWKRCGEEEMVAEYVNDK